jgi:hypothetical protein
VADQSSLRPRGRGLDTASVPHELMEWPMTSYPYLSRWYAQLQKRPSFQQAVVDCEPPGDRAMFASYVAQRRSEGTSVADMLNMSAA